MQNGGLPTIEFMFDYVWIQSARIEQWLELAWLQYAQRGPNADYEFKYQSALRDKARYHDYEN